MASYVYFRESNYDPLTIGGVDGEEWDLPVRAFITYQLPWVEKYQVCTVIFLLTNMVVGNTIPE